MHRNVWHLLFLFEASRAEALKYHLMLLLFQTMWTLLSFPELHSFCAPVEPAAAAPQWGLVWSSTDVTALSLACLCQKICWLVSDACWLSCRYPTVIYYLLIKHLHFNQLSWPIGKALINADVAFKVEWLTNINQHVVLSKDNLCDQKLKLKCFQN